MTKYILRRLIQLIPILLGVTLMTFTIIQITPGDPVVIMLGAQATTERVEEIREQLGLDDPVIVQYVRYVTNTVQGDLGKSIRGQTPVLDEILLRLPATLELAAAGYILAIIVGVVIGTVAAVTRVRWLEQSLMASALLGLSLPTYWLASLLILIFAIQLEWVPVLANEGLEALVLPAICLAVGPAASLARLTRSSILEVLREDYVRTAYSKGLPKRIINFRHVLRNALIPVVTVMGFTASSMLTGAVFVEVVFARPGLGRFAVDAVFNRDFPQVQGMVLFTALIFVLINLLVDVVYAVVDPRIRFD